MAVNAQQELIWQGRIHLGDEPGVYGDASYSGLTAELPITVNRLDPTDPSQTEFTLILDSEGLETYPGYPGHLIVVSLYEDDPTQPYHSTERVIVQASFRGSDNNRKEIIVPINNEKGPFRFSVRLRCDTTVNPGRYDDFIWKVLSLQATDYAFYGSLGFSA